MKIKLKIQERESQNKHDIHLVKNKSDSTIYCRELIIGSNANGYTVLTGNETVEIKNKDKVITSEHIIHFEFIDDINQNVYYHEKRAPSQSLSQEWENIGIDITLPQTNDHDNSILPTSYSKYDDDPLEFLINGNTKRDARLLLESNSSDNNRLGDEHVSRSNTNLIKNPLLNNQNDTGKRKLTHYPTTEYENNLMLRTQNSEHREPIRPFKNIKSFITKKNH